MADTPSTPWRRLRRQLWRQRSTGARWGIVLATLFATYLLAGFLLVPAIIKQQLIAQTREATGRDLAVDRVRFNPLRLALTISGLSLKEENGEPFAGWDSLYVNFEASSLFHRAFTFAAISLVKPKIHVHRLSADTFNFTSLLGKPAAAPDAPGEAQTLPGVLVREFGVVDGELVYRDDTHPEAAVLNYLPVNFSVKAFSTRAQTDRQTRAELSIRSKTGEQLNWRGDLSLPALTSAGSIEARGFDLAALSRFVDELLPFHLARGKLDFSGHYRVEQRPGQPRQGDNRAVNRLALRLSDGAVAFSDLALADKAARAAPPLEVATVQVDGISLDSTDKTIDIAKVAANGGKIAAVRAADGRLDLLKLFPAETITETNPQAPDAAPWLITLAKASLEGFRVQITDQGPGTPATLVLDPLRADLENFSSDNSQPLQVALDSGFNGVGRVHGSGTINLSPMLATLRIEAEKIPLAGFQPYISQAINIQLHSGEASGVGTLTYPEPGQNTGLSYQGDVGVDNLNTTDNRFDREFLSWKRLTVKDLHFQQSENRTTIDKIEFDQLYGRFAIRADGTTNIEKLLVPTAEPATPSKPMALTVGTIAIVDSAAYFADLTMNPDFRTGIFNLKGAVDDIDSSGGQAAKIDLKGQVDRYAPVTIQGQINPFKSPPALDLKLAFQNLDMTTLAPYAGVYAGHRIKQGQLSVELRYQLDNDQITGQNHIVMNQMELGERVASPKAIDLPLRLALALLKDRRGVIDLGLEVKGNIKEPSFSAGGLVFKALKNLVVKAVRSPFNLLAGLAGGSAEQLDEIAFAPGSEQLAAGEKEKLDKLAKALAERPQLRLNVTGNTLPDEDGAALAQRQLDRQLAALSASRGEDSDQPWPGLGAALADKGFRKKFYALYETTTRETAKARRKVVAKELGAGGNDPTDEQLESTFHDDLYRELLARQSVPVTALAALASRRALAVKSHLADSGKIGPERVFLVSDGNAGQPALSAKLALSAR